MTYDIHMSLWCRVILRDYKVAGKYRAREAGGIIRKLADIDYATKTGRTKAQIAIEQCVLKLEDV